jgi:hypothetical protein
MNRRLRVKLNMPALIAHLTREEQRAVSESDVVRWLKDAGFTASGDVWIVAEADLGHLDPSEVISVEALGDDASH